MTKEEMMKQMQELLALQKKLREQEVQGNRLQKRKLSEDQK